MVGKGVVESMLRVLGAVQGGGAEALAVQKAACQTLCNLADDADNQVRCIGVNDMSCSCWLVVWLVKPLRQCDAAF